MNSIVHDFSDPTRTHVLGEGRFLERNGRRGWQPLSPAACARVSGHTLNAPRGTMLLWVLPLEDLATCQRLPQHSKTLPNAGRYRLVSDLQERDPGPARFALAWDHYWHPNLAAKFAPGFEPWEIHNTPARAFVGTGHFSFEANHWYALALTWDHPGLDYRLYANGHLVGTADSLVHHFQGNFLREDAGTDLFIGNTAMVFSKLSFFDECLSRERLRDLYAAEAGEIPAELDAELEATYGHPPSTPFHFQPGPEWAPRFTVDGATPEPLSKFYLQGNRNAARMVDGHLEVRTGGGPQPNHLTFAEEHVYLWMEEFFEGDLYLEYDFMPLARGGLSLLVLQASGMQREDFMRCYDRRETGSMSMICWEDVRNYHWEYFREMNDVRNDRISHAMIKNPWHRVMGFSTRAADLYALNQWHRLQFLQQGNRLQCAVDGDLVLDMQDSSTDNNGPVLNCGRIAIRAMARTQIAFQNIKVFNRPADKLRTPPIF